MLTDLPELGDYVDVLGSDRVWRPGSVLETDPSKGCRVECLRSDSKFSEWLDVSSPRLLRYRLKTKCCDSKEFPSLSVTTEEIEEMQKCVKDALEKRFEYEGSAEIVKFFRGILYQFATTLLYEGCSSAGQFEAGVALFLDIVALAGVWAERFTDFVAELVLLQTHPGRMYETESAAIASTYPELFRILSLLLGSSTSELRFMQVILIQNSFATTFCKAQSVPGLETYFWTVGFEGKFLAQVVYGFGGDLQEENIRVGMCVLEQMPFWEYVSNHRQELAKSSVCSEILYLIYQKLIGNTFDYFDYADVQKLWQIILCSSQLLTLLGYSEYAIELNKAMLWIVLNLTKSASLEKKIAVMNLLQILGERAKNEENAEFAQMLSQWTQENEVCFAMLTHPHTEVLKRGKAFWKWLQCNQIFPIECLQRMIQSTAGAHESYREAMYDLIITLSEYFQEQQFAVLRQELTAELDALTLRFIKRLIESIDLNQPQAKLFAEEMIDRVRTMIFSEQSDRDIIQPAVQMYAELIRIPCFQSKAPHFFKEVAGLFFVNDIRISAKTLVLLLENFKEKLLADMLANFRADSGCSFISSLQKCILQSLSSFNHSWKSAQISALLICIDVIGCATYDIASKQSIITREELREVFVTICTSERENQGIQEDMFTFFEDCAKSSPWFSPDLALYLIKWLSSQPAIGFVRNLTMTEFEHLYELLIHANDETFEKSGNSFCYLKGTHIYGFVELVYISVHVLDADIHEVATLSVNQFLTRVHEVANKSLVNLYLKTIFENISLANTAVTERCLMSLKSVIEYEEKNRELAWNESELQTRVEECLKDIKIESQFREEAEVVLKNQIVQIAVQMNIRYNQVKFIVPLNQSGPLDLKVIELPYQSAEVAFLIDEEKYLQLLLGSLNCNSIKNHELVWSIVDKLIGKSRRCKNIEKLGSDYSECFKGKLDYRILSLKALLFLSKRYEFIQQYRSKRMDLFTQLNVILKDKAETSIKAISTHYQRVLLHFEVLFSLIDIHFVQQRDFLSTSQLAEAMNCLLVIGEYYSSPDTDKSYSSLLMQNIGDLMITTLGVSHEAEELAKKFDFLSFFNSFLIKSDSERFSEAASALLWRICETEQRFVPYFEEILVNLQDTIMEKWEKAASFFDLLGNLLTIEKLQPNTDTERLKLNACVLVQHSSGLLTAKLWKLIEGLVNLLTEEDAKSVVQESLSELFYYPETHPRYADSRHRRENLSCLKTICYQFPNMVDEVLNYLGTFYANPTWRKPDNWNISLDSGERFAYRGLINQGATCYMNATFQQLFGIDRFVASILRIQLSDSLLFTEFQRIISHLKFHGSGVVSAETMLYSLREVQIDPMEQADIVEFFEELMKRLEEELGVEREEVVDDMFRGRMMRTIVGKGGCTHVRHTTESFITLPLQLKNKRNLLTSLKSIIETELITDDNMVFCEECHAKVPSESSTRLYHLPNVLVISLRRFSYNIEEGKRYKINDKFEFPLSLNMKDVSSESSRPDDYFDYDLTGVVIHVGTAEAGHYYSLVNRGGVWHKFDDTVVTPFDISELAKEAFGGRVRSAHMNVDKSAYLLIYTRKKFYKYPKEDGGEFVPMEADVGEELSEGVKEIKEKSEMEQTMQLVLRQLMSVDYENFVEEMIKFGTISTLKFALGYFFTIHCRKKNWLTSKDLLRPLINTISQAPSVSFWICEVFSIDPMLNELLITAPVSTKKSFVLLFASLISSAPDFAVSLLLRRLVCKVERLSKIDSESYANLFELIHFAVVKIPNIAAELRVCDRLVVRLVLNSAGGFPELLVAPPMIYEAEGYFGHPMDQYSTLPEPSAKKSIAFQLQIINDLREVSQGYLKFFQENIQSIEADFILSKSTFEQKQAIDLLATGDFDISPLIARLYIAYNDADKSNEFRFLTFAIRILQRKDPTMLQVMLNILLENEPSQESSTWCWLLMHTYATFPTAEVWQHQDLLAKIETRMMQLGLESKIATVLQGLKTGMRVQPLPVRKVAAYGVTLPANTKVALDADKGKVFDSFSIVHVIKLEKGGHLRWVPAEADIELL